MSTEKETELGAIVSWEVRLQEVSGNAIRRITLTTDSGSLSELDACRLRLISNQLTKQHRAVSLASANLIPYYRNR